MGFMRLHGYPPKTVTKIRFSGLSPYAVPLRCSCLRCSLRDAATRPPEGSPLRLASHAGNAQSVTISSSRRGRTRRVSGFFDSLDFPRGGLGASEVDVSRGK